MVDFDDLEDNPYLLDILSQPEALRQALGKTDVSPVDPLAQALDGGQIDRIILTGMGASYYGLYPAWLQLAAAGWPAIWVDAAELVHHVPALVSERSMLWIASQSGRSAEVMALLDQIDSRPPAALLAMTNETSSSLAQATMQGGETGSRVLLPLYAKPEKTPSTRTYLHTLAIGQLAALRLARNDLSLHLAALMETADGIENYLKDWKTRMEQLGKALKGAESSIVLTGRGLSLASAFSGALNLQEAAKISAIGLQAAEFRHGPIEMAGTRLTALIFAGGKEDSDQAKTYNLNKKLWEELRLMGSNAWLLKQPSPQAVLPATGEDGVIAVPHAPGIGLPLAEIIPIQLLCVVLSLRTGITPGEFRHIGKVTTRE